MWSRFTLLILNTEPSIVSTKTIHKFCLFTIFEQVASWWHRGSWKPKVRRNEERKLRPITRGVSGGRVMLSWTDSFLTQFHFLYQFSDIPSVSLLAYHLQRYSVCLFVDFLHCVSPTLVWLIITNERLKFSLPISRTQQYHQPTQQPPLSISI